MAISVIVPVFNGSRYFSAFIDSLQAALPEGAQIIFVDDGSTEPVLEQLPDIPKAAGKVLILRNDRNLGYSAAVNRGFSACDGDFIVQLNTDLVLHPQCITSMLELIRSRSNVGVVGSKLLFPTNNLVQHIGMAFGMNTRKHVYFQLPADHPIVSRTRRMQILTGATVAFSRHVLDRLGPLDERYFNYNEDIDHCLKAVALGMDNYTCAESIAYHWVSQSGPSRFARVRESDAVFWRKWPTGYHVDLGDFVAEALSHVLDRETYLADLDFDVLNLCKTSDDIILIEQVRKQLPLAAAPRHDHRQVNNNETKYWLPMILPHRYQHEPRPFLYFVDHFHQLNENRLWFQNRLRWVREELIVDATGCVVTASELLSMGCLP